MNNSPDNLPPEASPPPVGRPRWPAIIALLAIGLLFLALSPQRTLGLGWLLLPILVVMIIMIRGAHWRGLHGLNRLLAVSAAGITTGALIASVGLLVMSLPDRKTGAASLLTDAIVLWVTNVVVFALWYWLVDGGGPMKRRSDDHEAADFLFPQTLIEGMKWVPGFIDYLFLAFNISTAFSPTDTPIMSTRAKLLMMLQASLSLVMLAVLAARAINTF
ncbi:MAG: hypothetical protein ABI947_21690 [Chloroflexota bacterium]